MNGACRSCFFSSSWGGAKRSKIVKFQLQSQFQRFLKQTLYVFSKIKDIKLIKQGFGRLVHAPGVVGLGGAGGPKFNFSEHVAYQIEGDDQ